MTTFAALGTPKALADTLTAQGIVEPFPIQVKTLPDTLAGRDVLGRGRTGSGKTIAFAIPLVARLAEREAKHFRKPGRPMGLVLAPTRELAVQVSGDIATAGRKLGARVLTIYGGRAYEPQIDTLRKGVDVVVGTPGRLLDLAQQGHLVLGAVRILVLDEADEMLDLGFLPDLEKLMAMVPAQRPTMLFSPTMPGPIAHPRFSPLVLPLVVKFPSAKLDDIDDSGFVPPIVERHPGERVVVVTHGGSLRRNQAAVSGFALPVIENCAVWGLAHEDGRFRAID